MDGPTAAAAATAVHPRRALCAAAAAPLRRRPQENLERFEELLNPSKPNKSAANEQTELKNVVSLAVEGKGPVAECSAIFDDDDDVEVQQTMKSSSDIKNDTHCTQWLVKCYSPNTLVHLSPPIAPVPPTPEEDLPSSSALLLNRSWGRSGGTRIP